MPLKRRLFTLLFLFALTTNFLMGQTTAIVNINKDSAALADYYKSNKLNYIKGKFGLRNEDASSGKRFWRSQLLIGGTEIVGMAILMALPKSITKWDKNYIKKAKYNLKKNCTRLPAWDKDNFAMNYIGHPIVGSYYYNAMRSQGSKQWPAFLFSTVQSFLWEYGIEGVAERPSTQDLLVTSTTGALLGEVIHRGTLRMGRNGFSTFEKVVVMIINPLFILNNKFSYTLNENRSDTFYSLHK